MFTIQICVPVSMHLRGKPLPVYLHNACSSLQSQSPGTNGEVASSRTLLPKAVALFQYHYSDIQGSQAGTAQVHPDLRLLDVVFAVASELLFVEASERLLGSSPSLICSSCWYLCDL